MRMKQVARPLCGAPRYFSGYRLEGALVRVLPVTLAATVLAISLSACSNASQTTYSGMPLTDVAPQLSFNALFVNDRDKHAVIVLKLPEFKEIQDKKITNGIKTPAGNWVDKDGNVYVANQKPDPGDVTEYDSELNLKFTYNDIYIFRPVAVRTDSAGNVYIAGGGSVFEFAQGTNHTIAACHFGLSHDLLGVAVNRQGDVFISDYDGNGPTERIREYPRGLAGADCAGVILPITNIGVRGMVIDPNDNLLVADDARLQVDVIPPPYDKISTSFGYGNLARPVDVTVDKQGGEAYVADEGAREIKVFTYPEGALKATLGKANGLEGPTSAVNSENYVP